MKTKIIISLLGLLFISGAFGDGCKEEEEPKPDYIEVRVSAQGSVLEKDSLNPTLSGRCIELGKSFQVNIKFVKAGGETFEETKVTNETCNFSSSTASFNLYREQPIQAYVKSENDIPGYNEHGSTQTLAWDEVYPHKDFGEIFYWFVFADVILVPE